MRYIYLYYDLKISSPLEVGKVELWSHVSLRKYINKALLVPGYGWIPCSKALSENFKDGEELIIYKLDKLEELPDKIRYYLNNKEERIRITNNAYENVKINHSWKKRVEEFEEILEEID